MPDSLRSAAIAAALATLCASSALAAGSAEQIARGKYLVKFGGCSDCHTPGSLTGHPDMTRYLGGSDIAFGIPGMGAFVPANLTPDKATGLGGWTEAQIVTAFTTGKRPDGRMLAPAMPYASFAGLSHADAFAIAAYLKSVPAVSHKVAGPFGATEIPTVPAMAVVPGVTFACQPGPDPKAARPAACPK
ncbi:MAG: c-type cytochrome [Rhodospirillales bacterium]|nr:c-type cytochrome [Rhodospirillales bacterium]MDE2198338.1 c-type cytochrome [Rhodospirillales bacterium]MDE2576372.1 c-type cytochrome [Rhodospirillales bacterium]